MKIFWLKIWKHTYQELLEELQKHVLGNPPIQLSPQRRKSELQKWGRAVFTPNPEICLKTLEDAEFLKILQQADYLTSDGIGLYLWYQINSFSFGGKDTWKADRGIKILLWILLLPYFIFNILFRKKYLYAKYGERICGSDITSSLVEFAQKEGIKIAIIDPHYPKDVEKCESQRTFREKLSEKFPKLDFDFYVYSEENSDEIFEKIADTDAKILFSTLGMKRQEISVLKWLEKCPNLRLGLWIGSSFDYYTGFQKRAPQIWRTLGFEWLYRIFTSPNKIKRLGRIYQALVVFPVKVVFYKK